jgi:PAS domain S-box-containing protein
MSNQNRHYEEFSKELLKLQIENARLKKNLEEHIIKISETEELLLKRSRSFAILNKYSLDLANQADEEIYSFIASQFKSFFSVKEVWLSIFDEKDSVLILKATTLTENDNSKIVRILGRKILGQRTVVTNEQREIMIGIGVGEPSSLNEITFGQIPVFIGSGIERLFGFGWFQGVILTDKGKLYGGLVVAGYSGQAKLQKDELQTFTEITSNILRRLQAEKKLVASELRFRELSDLLPQLVFEADIQGNITFINQFGLKMLGYSRVDLDLGLNINNLIISDERDSVFSKTGSVNVDAKPAPREINIIRKDGKQIPLFLHASLYTDKDQVKGIRGTGVDITELQETKEILSAERNLLRTLINNIPDRIYAKDIESRFIICNDALVKRMGKKSPDEVLGKSDLDLLPREIAMNYLAEEEIIIRTGNPIFHKEETRTTPSGQPSWSLFTKVPLRNSRGEITGIVGITRDITARKFAELEVERKNEQLEKIIAEKDKFFSIVAHDLRGPFNYFLGFTEIISDELDSMSTQKIREITLGMRKSASQLYSLLENLLEWSKMQQGHIQFTPQKFRLFDKVTGCVELISGPAIKKQIEIIFNIPSNIDVTADPHMFEEIVRNLVSNSIKFTPQGGKIIISGSETSEHTTEIKVSDSGIGMNPEMVKSLFKLNAQNRRKGTEGEESTGLGLILCKEFIEKHHGKLRVESEVGKGSSFSFTIPAGVEINKSY